jgi:hypothetical protein
MAGCQTERGGGPLCHHPGEPNRLSRRLAPVATWERQWIWVVVTLGFGSAHVIMGGDATSLRRTWDKCHLKKINILASLYLYIIYESQAYNIKFHILKNNDTKYTVNMYYSACQYSTLVEVTASRSISQICKRSPPSLQAHRLDWSSIEEKWRAQITDVGANWSSIKINGDKKQELSSGALAQLCCPGK